MSRKLEQEILEVATWANYNRKDVLKSHASVEKKLEFMDKCFDHLLWVLARAVEDIQKLEGRGEIFVPHSVRLDSGIRTHE